MPTLLLADDNVTVQRVIVLTFAGEPVRVIPVSDGREAMERLLAEPPDIILAGTTLPHVSGYELARFVREHPELMSVPVLLLSGAFEPVDQAMVTSSGAVGVVEKPVEPIALVSRVKELLGLRAESAAPGGRLVTAPVAMPLVVAPPLADSEVAEELKPDYLATLGAAFDSLDAKLTGQAAEPRNPAPPLGKPSAQGDPRSPTPRTTPALSDEPGNPVFEVDDTWFAHHDDPRRGQDAEQQLVDEMGIHDLGEQPAGGPKIAPASAPSSPTPGPSMPAAPVPAPEITVEMLDRIATTVAARLEGSVHIEPAAPEITGSMLEQIAASVSARLLNTIHVDAKPPELTPAMLEQVAGMVAEQLRPQVVQQLAASLRVEPAAPVITEGMLQAISTDVAQRLSGTIRVEPAAPRITDDMLAYLAQVVADELRGQVIGRLQETIRVEPAAPVITEAMQAAIAVNVAQRLAGSIRVEPAAPHLTDAMLDHIAARVGERLDVARVADHLRESLAATLRDTVRGVVLETSERLVRAEIERIRARAESSQA